MRVTDWFSEHPQALARAELWAEERRQGVGLSLRAFLHHLKANHEYPFSDHTALMTWVNKRRGEPPPEAPAVVHFKRSDADVRRLQRGNDFVITSAVNNCPVEPGFLRALERLAEERGAKIIVNPVRYRNPRTVEEAKEQEGEWWAPELQGYLLESEIRPHDKLTIMPTKVQATASNPLPPRLSGRTKHRSAVFGHPQLCMRTVPTPQAELPKILYSSGAVTQKRYSDTLAGELADFHHSHSAVLVEVRGKRFHLRDIVWDGEQFIDLDRSYSADAIQPAAPPLALVMGDIHVGKEDPNVMEATFGKGGIVPRLRPERLVLHDLFDGVSVSPHEQGKRLTRAALGEKGRDLEYEIRMNARWLNNLPKIGEIIVVASNHDAFLMRWLQDGEKSVEPQNRKMYHKLCYLMLEHHEREGGFPSALETAVKDHLGRRIRFLRVDESYRAGDIELGMHGHLGPNGARGTIRNLSQIGTRSMVGHSHSPGIWQGVYVVGLSAVYRHGYNVGPSSWLQTHGLVHSNGRRQLLHIIGKNYHGN